MLAQMMASPSVTSPKPPVLMGFCTHSQALITHKPLYNPDISKSLAKGQWSVRQVYIIVIEHESLTCGS